MMGAMGVHGFPQTEAVLAGKWLCVTHFVLNWQPTTSLIIITRYTHVHHVPHAEDMENCRNGEARLR